MSDSNPVDPIAEAESVARLKNFAANEMVACASCSRANPPNRANCLYCGAGLPGAALIRTSPIAKEIDDDSPAKALFLAPDQLRLLSPEMVSSLARRLNLKADDVSGAIQAGGPLPLITPSASEQEKRIVEASEAWGIQVATINEAEIATIGSRRIRGLELTDDSTTPLPNTSSTATYGWNDIVLIVVGRLITNRVEVEEKRRRGKTTPIGSHQFSSDESVMDVYFQQNEAWRICADNFDYSCLAERKGTTGFENFARLLDLIRERARQAEVDESYMRKRILLANVWPLDEQSRNTVSFAGKRKYKESTSTTNESQFNKYSRAAYLLKTKSGERVG